MKFYRCLDLLSKQEKVINSGDNFQVNEDQPLTKHKRWGYRRRIIHYFLLTLARILFFFITFEVHGKENIPKEHEGTLFVSNHLSHLDSIFMAVAAFPRKRLIHFMGAKDFMEKMQFKWTKYEGAFPVGRGKGEREKGIKFAITLLRDGSSVGIFPEGRRSRSGRMLDPQKGAGWIKSEVGQALKVIPVFIFGTQHIMPPHKYMIRFRVKTIIYFGKEIDFSKFLPYSPSPETSHLLVQEMIKDIKHLKKQFYNDLLNNSPN